LSFTYPAATTAPQVPHFRTFFLIVNKKAGPHYSGYTQSIASRGLLDSRMFNYLDIHFKLEIADIYQISKWSFLGTSDVQFNPFEMSEKGRQVQLPIQSF